MTSKFKASFDFDSDEDHITPEVSHNKKDIDNFGLKELQSKSVVLRKEKNQKDTYGPNMISKNDFFHIQDVDVGQKHYGFPISKSQIMYNESKTQTGAQNKSQGLKRKKVSTSIKLQPLRTLQLLNKNTQKVQLIQTQAPVMMIKKQSAPPVESTGQSGQFERFLSKEMELSRSLTAVHKLSSLNFEMESSSSDSDSDQPQIRKQEKNVDQSQQAHNVFDKPSQKQNTLFFQEDDDDIPVELSKTQPNLQKTSPLPLQEEKKPQPKQLKFKRTLKKLSNNKKIEQRQTAQDSPTKKSKSGQNSESEQNQAKVGIQSELNPQKGKDKQKDQSQKNDQNLPQPPQEQPIKHDKKVTFETLKSLLLEPLMKNSVLNLKLKRYKSLLNFFSPEFRIQFMQDGFFVMGGKKTSTKPTSTFVFSGSEFSFEETSKKYMGKMKSNLVGNVYNIFGPGLNPSTAKNYNIIPRELLATVVYKTELFGTGRPKEFTLFLKKPECGYYRDLAGVRMYQEQTSLDSLFFNYHQNMDKIQVFHTRMPIYSKQTKQYVMNFEGKVKKSSIKNFILEDRTNQNAKVMLFGKITDDQFAVDIVHPLTPMVGIGVALTMFDSRMGSD